MGMVFRGRGGDSPTVKADTLKSTDTFEIIASVGEGQNGGLENGLKSLFAGDTPIVASDGTANFKNWSVAEYLGTPAGHLIKPKLGGFAVPSDAINVPLAFNEPVVRAGTQTHIDFIDIRLLINQLVKQNDDGDVLPYTFRCKVEYRASDSATWLAAELTQPNPTSYTVDDTSTPGAIIYQSDGNIPPVVIGTEGLKYIASATTPAAPPTLGTTWWLDALGKPNYYDWAAVTPAWTLLSPLTDMGLYWRYQPGNGTEVWYFKPTAALPTATAMPVGSTWVNTALTVIKVFNGSAWVDPVTGEAIVQDTIALPPGELEIREKITSPTVFQIRFAVPDDDVPYDIRITKTSEETNPKNTAAVSWETFSEVAGKTFQWPNLHVLHILGKASNQLSGFPELLGIFKGRVVNVPTNYDPVTRVYTGIWDTTYKVVYTDNAAFCTQDFIENSRYGLSSLYPLTVNKQSFYSWGQWCDEAVPNGRGGTRPRWTINDVLDSSRPAKEYAQYMAGSAGGRLIDDGTGIIDVLVDRDTDACFLFSPENVVDGEFQYSYTDVQTRANYIKVGFINPDLNWNSDYRIVKDDDHIAQYGRIPLEFAAVGKIDESEALAAARLRLVTSTTETSVVSFRTNRQGKYIKLNSVILISDPDMGWGISGRVKAVTGARTFTLRDAVTLESGVTYYVNFTRPTSPFTTVRLAVSTPAGTVTSLTVTADLPVDLPAQAVFSLEAPNQAGLPKPYRVTGLNRVDGSNELVEIAAIELNRSKWAYIDGTGDLLDVVDYSNFNGPIPKVTGVRTRIENRVIATSIQRALIITWGGAINPLHQRVIVEYSFNGGQYNLQGTSDTNYWEIPNVAVGSHSIRLTRQHLVDPTKKGPPITVVHDVTGSTRFVPPISNLQLMDEPAPPQFETRSPRFTWDHGDNDASFLNYKLRILDGGDVVKRTESLTAREFIYDYTKNQTDFGGSPSRSFKVRVVKVDQYQNESTTVDLSVSNPAPATPTGVTMTSVVDGLLVKWTPCAVHDYTGTIVKVDGVTKYDGTGSQASIVLAPGSYTVTVAHYDIYGSTGLNTYSQAGVLVNTTVVSDTTPPANPTGFSIGASAKGIGMSWTNPGDADLDTILIYRFTANTSGSSVLIGNSSGTTFSDTSSLTVGATYWYWARARDRSGNINPVYALIGSAVARRLRTNEIGRASDDSALSDAELITSQGISLGFTNQGDLSTLNSVPPSKSAKTEPGDLNPDVGFTDTQAWTSNLV